MLDLPFYVSTNNKHLDCLRVFVYIFNHYLPHQELRILGYNRPPFDLPTNCNFISMGKQGGVQEWSTDLRRYFLELSEEYFIYGTEDVFFYKQPQINYINHLAKLIKTTENIGRINLVDATEGTWGWDSMVEKVLPNSPHYKVTLLKEIKAEESAWGAWKLYSQTKESAYSLTTQLSLWDRDFFLKYLIEGLSPWQFEMESDKASQDEKYKVLMVDQNFPIYKKEGYSLGTWENSEYWLHLLNDNLRNLIT